jgi:hypothetical protein
MSYNPSRGGHAPGHLREALLECLDNPMPGPWFSALADREVLSFNDTAMQSRWDRMSIKDRARWLTGKLWNCSDILPGGYDEDLDATYATAVRELRRDIP